MNVSLTPHLEAMIREKVESGRYSSSSEVVREALRLLEERDKLERLRTAIAVGEESVAQGRVIEWTPERADAIWQRAVSAAGDGKKPKPDVCP